jgi:YidC/Oxa1 family membrane protein insertase
MMVFFGLMFYKMAAGLCIYFIATSLWGLAERRLLPKRKHVAAAAATAKASPGPIAGPAKPKPRPNRKDRGKNKPKEKEDGALQKVRDWWAEVLKQAKKK